MKHKFKLSASPEALNGPVCWRVIRRQLVRGRRLPMLISTGAESHSSRGTNVIRRLRFNGNESAFVVVGACCHISKQIKLLSGSRRTAMSTLCAHNNRHLMEPSRADISRPDDELIHETGIHFSNLISPIWNAEATEKVILIVGGP